MDNNINQANLIHLRDLARALVFCYTGENRTETFDDVIQEIFGPMNCKKGSELRELYYQLCDEYDKDSK